MCTPHRMLRHCAVVKALWLLAIALFAVRAGDAHLHVCDNGGEQPVTRHVGHAPAQHHADHSNSQHEDRELDISDPAFLKKPGDMELPIAILAALLLGLLTVLRSSSPLASRPHFVPISVFELRPPLRGPPY